MHTHDDTRATDMSCGFGQRRHAWKIVNLRQPNLSWLEGQGRPARAMGISVSLLGMALQSRPAYACSCIPAAIHHPDHVDTSICWLLGSKHEDTTTQATPSSSHEHVLESILLVLLLNYSIPSPWHQYPRPQQLRPQLPLRPSGHHNQRNLSPQTRAYQSMPFHTHDLSTKRARTTTTHKPLRTTNKINTFTLPSSTT